MYKPNNQEQPHGNHPLMTLQSNMQRALKTARYVYYMCDKLKLSNAINEILFSIKQHIYALEM